jgi:uncharacterized cupin superfamily protein
VITRTAGGEVEVALDPLPPSQTVAGAPAAGAVELPAPPGLAVGIWEHSVGTSTDVEEDEVFVVLSGRATIVVEGGAATEVGPGDVVALRAGTPTTWTVHETLRKVYVVADG